MIDMGKRTVIDNQSYSLWMGPFPEKLVDISTLILISQQCMVQTPHANTIQKIMLIFMRTFCKTMLAQIPSPNRSCGNSYKELPQLLRAPIHDAVLAIKGAQSLIIGMPLTKPICGEMDQHETLTIFR